MEPAGYRDREDRFLVNPRPKPERFGFGGSGVWDSSTRSFGAGRGGWEVSLLETSLRLLLS